ncbi:hypothetical protein CYY_003564 [Polysphondylium violaceum]|uniref:WD40 repeat-containing protein n=1 Tax=Polysphondylium violaceum TaxID=133409 RepID=A0A8J4PZH4_9MYCE|nr:hypothetical protein CYY_003564 [Polysphondylium violaceum]
MTSNKKRKESEPTTVKTPVVKKEPTPPPKSNLKTPTPTTTTTTSNTNNNNNNNKSTKEITQVISVGCYENSILGYEALLLKDHKELQNPDGLLEVHLSPIYGYSSHSGCIKSLSACKNTLVSSSTDETSKVYNLQLKKEMGTLSKHEGYITCTEFYKNTHMLAGSMDKSISVWRVSDWECLKVMTGPKGAINAISIHPTGKAALSVSKDKRLFLWNLNTGKAAFFTKFRTEPFLVKWSPSGEHYVVVFSDNVTIFDKESKELFVLPFKQQVLAVKFFDDDNLLVGGEDKIISVIEYKKGKVVKTFEGHDNRIKGLETLSFKSCKKPYIVSISSDGNVVIWNIDSIYPVGLAETGGFRLTTLCVGPVEVVAEDYDDEYDEEVDQDYDSDDEEGTPKKLKVKVEYSSDEDEEEDEEDEDEEDDGEDGEEEEEDEEEEGDEDQDEEDEEDEDQ